MHPSSMNRMRWFISNYLTNKERTLSVLDVGSQNVNGSYRELFPVDRFIYKGLDMAPGSNVDIVPANSYLWGEIACNEFDVVISG